MTMGSNLTLKDKKLFIEAKKPFFILGEYMSVEINQNEPIEPENTGLTQERMSASAPMCPNWRGEMDEVRNLQKFQMVVKRIYEYFGSILAAPP